jgi:hypothetical protein
MCHVLWLLLLSGWVQAGAPSAPPSVFSCAGVVSIAPQGDGTVLCLATSTGKVYCNTRGGGGTRMGGGIAIIDNLQEIHTGPEKVASVVSAHADHTYSVPYFTVCAITVSQKIRCWGDNMVAQAAGVRTMSDDQHQDHDHHHEDHHGGNNTEYHGQGSSFIAPSGSNMGINLTTYAESHGSYSSELVDIPLGADIGAVRVQVGHLRTCASCTDGQLRCWGLDSSNQLGRPVNSSLQHPIYIGLNQTVKSFAHHRDNICVVTVEKQLLLCWGDYRYSGHNRRLPYWDEWGEQAILDLGIGARLPVVVSMGAGYTCVLVDDGSVRCWGMTSVFAGSTVTTVANPHITTFGARKGMDVCVSEWLVVVLLDNGSIQYWGAYTGTTVVGDGVRNTVVKDGKHNPSNLTCSHSTTPLFCVMIRSDEAAAYQWCYSAVSKTAGIVVAVEVPDVVPDTCTGVNSTVGTSHRVDAAGNCACLNNTYVAPYVNLPVPTPTPTPLPTIRGSNCTGMDGMGLASGCILSKGMVYCGSGTTGMFETRQVQVATELVTAIASGESEFFPHHITCAITASQAVRCWGDNVEGLLGRRDQEVDRYLQQTRYDANECTAVYPLGSYELYHGVACNATELVDVPLGVPAVSIRVHKHLACAACTDGQLRCWGYRGDYSRWMVPLPSIRDPLSIGQDERVGSFALSETAMCVVAVSGALSCWGQGLTTGHFVSETTVIHRGQAARLYLNIQQGFPVKVSMGSKTTCVVVGDGSIQCWGLYRSPSGEVQESYSPMYAASAERTTFGARKAVDLCLHDGYVGVLLDDQSIVTWGLDTATIFHEDQTGLHPVRELVCGGGQICAVVDSGFNGTQPWCYSYWSDTPFANVTVPSGLACSLDIKENNSNESSVDEQVDPPEIDSSPAPSSNESGVETELRAKISYSPTSNTHRRQSSFTPNTCMLCPVGTACPQTSGNPFIIPCANGMYSSQAGLSACEQCPANTYTPITLAPYRPSGSAGLEAVVAAGFSQCLACQAGRTSPVGASFCT